MAASDEAARALPVLSVRRLNLPLCGLLALSVIVRLFHLTEPPCDYHDWRQTITLMVARDFARHGFELLHPRLLWLGKGDQPAYFAAEFPLQSIPAAALFRIFGENDTIPRLVVIVFSVCGIWFLYAILRRGCGPLAAFLGAFLYALFPCHLFFGRVFMPDVPALSLALGGVYFMDRWTETGKAAFFSAAALITCLALLQKLTVGVVLLPIGYLLFRRYRIRMMLRTETWIFAGAVGVPVFLWYRHSWNLSLLNGFQIIQPGALGSHLDWWLTKSFLWEVGKALSGEVFSPAGLLIVAFGLFWPARNRTIDLFRVWFLAAAGLLFLVPVLLRGNYYYLSALLPAGAALGGIRLAEMVRASRNCLAILALVLSLFGISALTSAAPMYELNLFPWQLGIRLREITSPTDLIVTENGGSPGILYYADRRGWFLENNFDADLITRLRDRGAAWYADSNPRDAADQPVFVASMDQRFRRVHPGPRDWLVYRLR